MKKRLLQSVSFAAIVLGMEVTAREVRTPIMLMEPTYLRYPVEYHHDYDQECGCWDVKVWGGAWSRDADDAFGPCGGEDKVPWTNLIFGKSSFVFSEVFFGAGGQSDFIGNPFLAVSTITPQFDYHEKGAAFGVVATTTFDYCDVDYRCGINARIPVRDIHVQSVCGGEVVELLDETLANIYQQRNEIIGTSFDPLSTDKKQTNYVFAIRLDFLSQLLRANFPNDPMVTYGTGITNPTTIAGQTAGADVNNDLNGIPPVAVIARADGTMPFTERWGDRVVATTVPAGTPPSTGIVATLNGDGSGVANNQRGKFNESNDYTPLSTNIAAQSKLFVVPTLQGGVSPDNNTMSNGANQIQAAINQAIETLPVTATNFLLDNGIDFCDGRSKGLGDLQVDFYIGRNWGCCNEYWTDLMLGFTAPTADSLDNCLQVLKQPLGNNGHWEARGTLAGGWSLYNCFKVMADITVSKVLSATERVAAPFVGATVKNIGPCMNARIDWWHALGHVDMTFFANDCCGFDLGYEGYHKGCDNICLCSSTAVDFFDVTHSLDATILSQGTERTAHKVRVGFFTLVNCCELFAGWSYTFAGKNISDDTDWYIKLAVNF